jgi:hypothetical protein
MRPGINGITMLESPSLEQRVRWHLAHAKACACRDIPRRMIAEMRRRGISLRKR